MKKTAVTVVTAGVMTAFLAFPCGANAENLPVTSISDTAAETTVTGPMIVNCLEHENNVFLPVRKIAEHFGYAVGWQEEGNIVTLTKGAQYLTFSIGQDAYTFAKTAPYLLGAAPYLSEDVTYVPVAFFTDLLGLNCHKTEGTEYKIVQPSRAEIAEIQQDGRLVVKDEMLGEVVVSVTEETILTANGDQVSANLLEQGQSILIEYADAMTASLPPQGFAVQIEILNLPVDLGDGQETGVAFEGIISELPGENRVMITPDGTDDPERAVCLVVSEETVITKGNDKRIYKIDDLTAGTKISGIHSEAMTMSIPPQTVALEIKIEE